MSKERARRRAEREAVALRQREAARRRRARRDRGAALLRPVTAPIRALRGRRPAPDTALGRARGRENGVLLAVLLAAHAILWLLTSSWWLRGSALALTLLAWPLLTVLIFDRRPTR